MSTRRNSRQTARRPGARPRRYTPYSLYRRALRLEPLEDRRLLAVVTVNTLSDTVAFNDGLTSLREAIFATNTVPGADVIEFAPSITSGTSPKKISLTQGELVISDSLSIDWLGAGNLTIDASGSDPTPELDNGDGSRVFSLLRRSGVTFNVTLFDITVVGGDTSQSGGGIYNGGASLTISGGQIISNAALGGELQSGGGGVYSASGKLTLKDTIISENHSSVHGGGLYVTGSLEIIDSSVSDNTAGGGAGGIYFSGSKATILRTVIERNTAGGSGGGIVNKGTFTITASSISQNVVAPDIGLPLGGGVYNQGALTIESSTISDNAALKGAGLFTAAGFATVSNSTISGNMSGGIGGGIYAFQGGAAVIRSTITRNTTGITVNNDLGASVLVKSSIVADNIDSDVDYFNNTVNTFRSDGFNVIGTGNSITKFNATGDQTGIVNPFLGPLANNGGPTKTHALLAGSPAINAGDLSLVAGVNGVPQYDQRGTPFGRVFNGRIDIGAFEYQQPSDLNLVVDTLVDESDGNYARGDLSLREAILLANTYAGPNYPNVIDTIHFDPALTANGPARILLTKGELKITSSVVIIGLGSGLLTVDASGNDTTPMVKDGKGSRIFNIGVTSLILNVSISGLTLTGGDAGPSGGAILNSATNLSIDDVAITGNSSRDAGGGLSSGSGNIVIRHSTVADNTANAAGGGIRTVAGNLTLSDSTISGNVLIGEKGSGGGVYFNGSTRAASQRLEITRSKILNNSAKASGGGVTASIATVVIVDSEIAGNSSLATFGPRGAGIFLQGGGSANVESSNIHNNTLHPSGVGGGIFSQMSLVIRDSSLTANFGGKNGGGIYSTAALQVFNSTITGNSTQDSSGGGGVTTARGGNLQVVGSTISTNLGNGIRQLIGSLTVTDSVISSNATSNSGGGIYANGEVSNVTITRTQITNNQAALDGGGIERTGGINTTLAVFDSIISHNSAQRGGGGIDVAVPSTAAAKIDRTEMDQNSAGQSGGAILKRGGGSFELSASTLLGNTAGTNGGGIAADTGTLRISTSTLTENSASTLGGGVWAGQNATISTSTLYRNHAGYAGGGVFIMSGPLVLDHSIVASDTAPSGPDVTGLLGATVTARYSLIRSEAGSGLAPSPIGLPDSNGNFIGGNIDPKLAPLSRDAGPTAVYVPLPGSPLINGGDPTVVGQGMSDQRGAPFARVFGGRIDIGSVESQPTPLLGDYNNSGSVDASDYVLWRKTKGSTTDLRADGNGDRLVNNADYQIWSAHFGETRQIIVGPIFATAAGASVAAREIEDVATPIAPVLEPTHASVSTPVYAVTSIVVSSTPKTSLPIASGRLAAAEPASTGLLAWLFEGDRVQRSLQRRVVAHHEQDAATDEMSVPCDEGHAVLDEAFATL